LLQRRGRVAYRAVQRQTVQAMLAARMDRLPPEEKRLLQTAAVIGTEVPLPLLQALAERLGDAQRLGRISCYLCIYLSNMEEHERAIAAGQRALALATTSGAFDVQVVAQTYLGVAYFRVGDFRQALDVSRRVMPLLTGERRSARFGQVALPAVTSCGYMACSLAELGGFAEGHSVGEEAVRLAEAIE